MPNEDQFKAVFARLKSILEPFAPILAVQADEPAHFSLDTPYLPELKKGLFFGAVRIKKRYVSFHLMPVYVFPALMDTISPELKQRMQGKSCFNFTHIEQRVLDELALLTANGYEHYKQAYTLH